MGSRASRIARDDPPSIPKQMRNNPWEAFKQELQPGEHIITTRKGDLYDHHGIYLGGDRVVHFQAPLEHPLPPGYIYPSCQICNYVHPQAGGVVVSCLACFHKLNSLCVIRYRKLIPWEKELSSIWNSVRPGKVIYGYESKKIYLELFKQDGEFIGHLKISEKESEKYKVEYRVRLSKISCVRSPGEVLRTAQDGSSFFGKYHLMLNNCEDFAVYCKTGTARSLQAEKKFKKGIPFLGKYCYKAIKCVIRYFDRKKLKKKLRERLEKH